MNKSVCIIRSNSVRPDSRVEKEAYSLKKHGYDVCVLAWDRDDDHQMQKDELSIMGYNIPIIRLGYRASFGEGFKNIVPYLKFQFGMRRFLKKHSFDIVHACDFDTAFFSQNIILRKKKKFIFDIFDFIHSAPKSFFQKAIFNAQIRLINRSDATIICTEDRRNQIKVSRPKKLAVIHNSPPDILEQETGASLDVVESNKIKVVYVGILQDYRLLKELGQYFSCHPEFEWHVGGFGKHKDYFEKLSKEFDNIKFYGRLSYDKTIELEKKCDICLAIYDPSIHNHLFAAPNKLYESLMLGKPVIMVKNTGMSSVVESNDIGVLIDYSYEGFCEGMSVLVSRKNEWPIMSEKMKNVYREQFSWSIMEKRLVELYSSL